MGVSAPKPGGRLARPAVLDSEQLLLALASLSGYHSGGFDAVPYAVVPCAETSDGEGTAG